MFDPRNKNAFVCLITGRRNKGKTSLLVKMLLHPQLLRNKFHEVYLINPTYESNAEKYQCVKFTEVITKFDTDVIEGIKERCTEQIAEDPKRNFLLILDDCMSEEDFKSDQSHHILNDFACNSRHINLSVVILSQVYKGVSLTVRRQLDYLIFFSNCNHQELGSLYEEYGFNTKRSFMEILDKQVFKDKHDFLFIDNIEDKAYRNFDLTVNVKKYADML